MNKKLTKLVGLKKEEFDSFVKNRQIILQPARLIPTHKTGDEMALTSIFLSCLKLVKEYRESLFKEIKLTRAGKTYYYTEASFKDLGDFRIDGLIIVVKAGKIADAAFFEMKNKGSKLDEKQIQTYLDIAKTLKVDKLITISNEFVPDPTHSPVNVKVPKQVSLFHFSWTYLITQGQLLLFKNDTNIQDADQVEIMSETLHYFESPVSGINGYTQMSSAWKDLTESVKNQTPKKPSDQYIEEAILSWYEEEKHMALIMSRHLGALVKPSSKKADSLQKDIKKVISDESINGTLIIKDAVSDIKLLADFARRTISMSIKITPPLDKGNQAKITWLSKQLERAENKYPEVFNKVKSNLYVEAQIKYRKSGVKVKVGTEFNELSEISKDHEIQNFTIEIIRDFGSNFGSVKKFIELIELMALEFYEAIVQNMTTWTKPAPKLIKEESND